MTVPNAPLVAADLEGVFLPEIWIAVAERTGIQELRKTTRDIADYDTLMAYRMDILDRHGLTLDAIQAVIAEMEPLPGARALVDWIRARTQFVILTDSFYDFVQPFMPKLGYPTIFAHQLLVDDRRMIRGYRLRVKDSKRKAVEAFSALGFRTMAFGDSYNDTTMLGAADRGVLFRPPQNVVDEFPQFPVTNDYDALRAQISRFLDARLDD
ncbi:MAG: bifunctional phosphoserine phosphatase/homoserine phosphotransferase ThrH [Caldilineaceae bacterium]|nr:bifunctional phosphoserine phosphatase/homoserine phosphotransferase ThrH [Caldilineaceae bacterium]